MKMKFISALCLLAMSIVIPAKADSIQFELYNPNAGISAYPAPFVSVTLSVPDGGGAATFTVESETNSQYVYGFTSFGINTTQPVVLSGFSQPGFVDAGFINQDGFGQFDVANGQPGSSSAIFSLTFTATSETDFVNAASVLAVNSLGLSAAGHIYVFDLNGNPLATGFAANGTGDTDPPAVPEPTTLLLFGSGIVGIAGIIRKTR